MPSDMEYKSYLKELDELEKEEETINYITKYKLCYNQFINKR